MKPIYLDVGDSITAVMAAAAITTNPDYTAHFRDTSPLSTDYMSLDGTLNGINPVTMIVTPVSAPINRLVDNITIQNKDSAPVIVTVNFVSGAGTRVLWKGTLQINDTWSLADGVMDANGNMKMVLGTATPYPSMVNRIIPVNTTVPAGYAIVMPTYCLLNAGINLLLSAGADMRII